MKISLQKLKAMLLYFANNTNPIKLGKVKLMKLFYFADFEHVRAYGAPITYDTYKHYEHGPIPSTIKNLVDTLCDTPEDSVLSDTIKCQKKEKIHLIKTARKMTESDLNLFSRAELRTLESVARRFYNARAKDIEDESHRDKAWLETEMLEDIPYKLAFDGKPANSSEEDLEVLLKLLS